MFLFFFSSRRRHTRFDCDWSSDVCSSDLRSFGLLLVTMSAPVELPLLRFSILDDEIALYGRADPACRIGENAIPHGRFTVAAMVTWCRSSLKAGPNSNGENGFCGSRG